ncbi:MAG: hypothetical protein PHF40_01080 [Candidatus Pacebacteria bacterium]|nr:hypothetical protein [Candidatus Paceibacterota bacterium]
MSEAGDEKESHSFDEPLMFQLREFIPEEPMDAYMSKSTGCAGREDEYDD